MAAAAEEEERRLVIAVEGTAALGPYWPDILGEYVEKIGKRNPQAADPPVDHAKNPRFLVLLSEDFMEARTALSLPLRGNLAPNQTILKMDSVFANPSVSGPMIGRKPVGVVGISTATVKAEPATIPAMISSSQLEQGGVGASGLGPTAISSVPTTMPTPGMAQQTGANFLGVTKNFDINMPIGQHPNAQQPPSKFVKIWEGTLTALRQGQSVFICKLEGYRSGAASEKLAADWPDTMQIVSLVEQEDMNDKKYAGKAEFLVFRSSNQHGFLGKLKKKKLSFSTRFQCPNWSSVSVCCDTIAFPISIAVGVGHRGPPDWHPLPSGRGGMQTIKSATDAAAASHPASAPAELKEFTLTLSGVGLNARYFGQLPTPPRHVDPREYMMRTYNVLAGKY